MKKIVALLVLGSLFLGTGLSVAASAGEPDLDGVVYWSEDEVNSLFSPDLMRTLNLTPGQRNSFQELRSRDWGYRQDHRYSRDLDALFSLGRMIRPGGSRVVIERGGSNNLDAFLAVLAFGILISQAQDNDRYYNPGYGYDYGYGSGQWIRIDDFLYLFFRILDMNQRRTFTVYFDRWYDDYYFRRDHRRDYERNYWEMMRDWGRRLRLSEKQRRDMERYFRDLHNRQWERDRRYRDFEKDYLKRNWDRDSFRDIDKYRRDLLKRRQESLTPPPDSRDRFRSILDDKQRRTFDSMISEREPRRWDRERTSPPKLQEIKSPPKVIQNKPAPPKFQDKPAPPKIQNNPGPPKVQNKPAPPKFQNNPGPPKIQNKPAPPKFQNNPGPPKIQNKPAPPKVQNKPAPPKLPKNPGPSPGQKKPGPPIVKKPVKDGK